MFDVTAESREQARSLALPWGMLEGRRVLITGATGLIGFACARLLLERNRLVASDGVAADSREGASTEAPIIVTCLVRDEARAREVFAGYSEADGLEFIVGSVEDFPWPEGAVDYIVHTACPTASRFFTEHPVETADAVVLGTRQVLELARAKGSAGVAYASSMEAYGDGNAEPGLTTLLDESRVGYVDPMRVRSCYPEGKRMAEQYCCAYAAEYGVPAMVVRLAQTFGPGIPKTDTRLFAMCARNALAGEDIVLNTTGASTRMYLYTADAVSALFTVMLSGEPGCAYNAANPDTYSSVRAMAEMVAKLAPAGAVEVRCEVDPNAPYPPEHHLPLDVSRLRALGWEPTQDLPGMYRNLMAYLED